MADDDLRFPDEPARHRRVDERPSVRELDDRQLAAEALASLRAERHPLADDPGVPGLIAFDAPPAGPFPDDAATDDAPPVSTPLGAGRHRRAPGSPARTVTPPRHLHRRPEAPAPAPPAAPTPLEGPASTAGVPPIGSGTRRRAVGWAVAVGLLVVAGIGVTVAVVGRDVPASPGPVAPVVGVSTTDPASGAPAAPAQAGTASPAVAPTSAAGPPSTVAPRPTTAPTAASTVPAPAVVSTLSPGDDGFGWPSTAFGSVNG